MSTQAPAPVAKPSTARKRKHRRRARHFYVHEDVVMATELGIEIRSICGQWNPIAPSSLVTGLVGDPWEPLWCGNCVRIAASRA